MGVFIDSFVTGLVNGPSVVMDKDSGQMHALRMFSVECNDSASGKTCTFVAECFVPFFHDTS